jgi:hypothetical protein
MPFAAIDPTLWQRQLRRTVLIGAPNSGKTTSFRTWPGPLLVVAAPGEKGTGSIPLKTTDGIPVKAFSYNIPEGTEGAEVKWAEVASSFRKAIFDGLKEKPKTIAIDGLHHVHRMYANEASFGALAKGQEFDPRLWGNAHNRFFDLIDQVQKAGVEYVVGTIWDELEKDNPDEKGSSPSRHIMPSLPGAAAPRRFMGEWTCAFYALSQGGKYIWMTKPQGQVWGATTKLPLEIAEKVPQTIPQDWGKFEAGVLAVKEGKPWPT